MDSHNQLYPHVWSKGEVCLAPYAGDDKYYPAHIKKVLRNGRGNVMALVSYDDYDDDEDDEVPINKLKQIPREESRSEQQPADESQEEPLGNTSLFSPLRGDEEKQWLEQKYEALDVESGTVLTIRPKSSNKRWETTKKALADPVGLKHKPQQSLISHSGKKQSTVGGSSSIGAGTSSSGSPLNRSLVPRGSPNNSGWNPEFDLSSRTTACSTQGFGEEDMEKPRLTHPPQGPKEPLVLSEPHTTPVVEVPALINQYLRDYQKDGVKFLYKHYAQNQGCLLGDDMGLGKTVQVIGFIAAILGKTGTQEDLNRQRLRFIRQLSDPNKPLDDGPKKTILIIGPASVLYNWKGELETWGHFNIGRYHQSHKAQTIADLKKKKLDVVVTTFETCRDNIDLLNQFEWTAVIADEAHKIKGLKASTTRALRQLNCPRRYGLTGTALQNKLQELWTVMDWCQPNCMGSLKEFTSQISRLIEHGQKHDATKRELAEARKAKEKLAQLRSKWMIRRTKALIADQLPKKSEHVVYCKPASLQLSIYKAILAHPEMRLVLTQNHPCDCDSASGLTRGKCCYQVTKDGRKIGTVTLSFMHLLSKAANHVALLIPGKTPSNEQQTKANEICQAAFAAHPEFLQLTREASFRTLSNPKYCGKMRVLQGLLKVFYRERSKVLLFSLSTQLLDILEQYVMCTGYEYRRLDGKTPNVMRVPLVQEFNRDPNIFLFLASTKAGGVGLNLTGANVVIIFDPNWNPSHDLQAQDRAYRLGQGRDVRVYRLICSGTIEENVYLRQIYKQQLDTVAIADTNAKRLFHGVQGDRQHKGELFGIENMFQLREGDSCLTSDILERHTKMVNNMRGFHVEEYVSGCQNGNEEEEEDTGGTSEEEEEESEDPDHESDEDLDRSSSWDEEDGFPCRAQRVKAAGTTSSKRCKAQTTSGDDYGMDYIYTQMMDVDLGLNSDEDDDDHRKDNNDRKSVMKRTSSHQLVYSSEDESESGPVPKSPIPSTSSGIIRKNIIKNVKSPKTLNIKTGMKRGKDADLDMNNYGDDIVNDSDEESPKKRQKTSRNQNKVKFECPGAGKNEDHRPLTVDQTVPTSFESVGDVFRDCGVIHLHENQRVVARSRVEDHISRCAVQDVYELHQHSQVPAMNCDPLSESSEESDDLGVTNREAIESKRVKAKKSDTEKKKLTENTGKRRSSGKRKDPSAPRTVVLGNRKVLVGQTPKGIQKQLFERMVRSGGFSDVLDLAQHVIKTSEAECQKLLANFYTAEDVELQAVFTSTEISSPPKRDKSNVAKKTPSKGRCKSPPSEVQKTPKKAKKSPQKRGCQYESDTEEEDDGNGSKSLTRKEANDALSAEKFIDQIDTDFASDRRKSVPRTPKKCVKNRLDTSDVDNRVEDRIQSSVMISNKATLETDVKDFLEDIMNSEHHCGTRRISKHIHVSPMKKDESGSRLKRDICDERTKNPERQHRKEKTAGLSHDIDPFLDNFLRDEVVQRKAAPKRRSDVSLKKVTEPWSGITSTKDISSTGTRDRHMSMPIKSARRLHGSESEYMDIFELDAKVKSDVPKSTQKSDAGLESLFEDFFGDDTKWKSTDTIRKSQKPSAVDSMIQETNDSYDGLFREGKMKKVKH